MRALMCRSIGSIDDLRVEALEPPRPGRGQIALRVAAAGVNFPDVLLVRGLYQRSPTLPFSPGLEVAGEVSAMGEGVSGVALGQRVMATVPWGGFAEEAVVDVEHAVPIPAELPSEVAAALPITYGTSWHALVDRGRLRAGETLAVLGAAGGVGLAAVEIGRARGARVIACASSPEKLELCRTRGADVLVDYVREDLKLALKEHTGGLGVDVLFDPVGSSITEDALRAMAWGGRYLVVGFASGDIPKVPLNLPLLKGCEIVGVFWGGHAARSPSAVRDDLRAVLTLHAEGRIRPHLHGLFPLERAAEALREVAERRVRGKAVVVLR